MKGNLGPLVMIALLAGYVIFRLASPAGST